MDELVQKYKAACLELEAGKFDNAENQLKEIIKLNPADYKAINKLGVTFANREDYKKAEDYFRDALEINPDFSPALVNLGNIFLAGGDMSAAADYYKAAVEMDSDNCIAHYNLAVLYKRNGDIDRYMKHMKNYKRHYKIQTDNETFTQHIGENRKKNISLFFLVGVFGLFIIFNILTG